MSSFSHIDKQGNAQIVDVSEKLSTKRVAIAHAIITMQPKTVSKICQNELSKGDALAVARVAGILAAKRTDELIPLCHTLPLADLKIDFFFDTNQITVQTKAVTTAQTGVEMEALTAATVAALTIYDMAKAVDKQMVIHNIHLVSKTGGKSGDFVWEN